MKLKLSVKNTDEITCENYEHVFSVGDTAKGDEINVWEELPNGDSVLVYQRESNYLEKNTFFPNGTLKTTYSKQIFPDGTFREEWMEYWENDEIKYEKISSSENGIDVIEEEIWYDETGMIIKEV